MKYVQIKAIFLVSILGGSTHGDGESEKALDELQDRFENFFRETLAEFRKLSNAIDKLSGTVGKLQKDQDKATADLSSLRVDLVQINENLKSLTQFTLATQNYDRTFPKADVFSWSLDSWTLQNLQSENLPGLKRFYVPGNQFPGQCNNVLEFPIRSIRTYGTCIRLYTKYDCSGLNLMVSPVSNDYNDFKNINLKSMGPCSLYEKSFRSAK